VRIAGAIRRIFVAEETEYCLLGPLEVRQAGVVVPVPQGQQRILLAALLLRGGRPVGVDELAEALWGADLPSSVPLSLQNCVMRLRKTLGSDGAQAIVTQPDGYLIRVGPGDLDVTRFESSLAAGRAAARAGSWAEAAAVLGEGLALWRGEPLSGVPSEALLAREVQRLAELRLQAAEARIDADLHLGRHADVIVELRQLVAAEPLRERLHALLMTAQYRDGQQAAALAAYQAARSVLLDELGAEPGPELQRLQQQILTADPLLAVAGQQAPGGQTGTGVRYSLPPDTAAFTGRNDELKRITATVTDAARSGGAVAIDGMPGVGKTALAVRAAHLLRDQFPDRQLFIDLRGHTPGQDPVAPAEALAGLLAAAGTDPRSLPADLAGRAGLWRDRMARQRALLVLDNAANSAQVTPLLPGGDECLVLVTSRRHLADLPGSAVGVLLETLPPDKAREMFIRLAPRAADEPAVAVAKLVTLAGFLPLAISLLARVLNRHPAWTLADLAAETRASLLTLTAEQDSVAAVFSVSYQHLDPGQQEFFRRLGLNPGTTVDAYAAAALADVPLAEATGHLDVLHGEGLLTETGYRRYGMHDLIRKYAADRAASDPLADREEALGRLLDYYQHTAARAEALLGRHGHADPASALSASPPAVPALPDSDRALTWARADRASLVACIDHAARAGDHARVIALTAAMAELLRRDGPWAEAITRHAAALRAARHLGHRAGQAIALTNLGIVRRLTGDYPVSAQVLGEALAIFRALGDRLGQAVALNDLGIVRESSGDHAGGTRLIEEALDIFRDVGDRRGQANALHGLGGTRLSRGDYPGAARILQESLEIFRDLGDRRGQARALIEMGAMMRMAGDYPGAGRVLEETLRISRDLGDPLIQANALLYLGAIRHSTGDDQGAAQALGEAVGIYVDIGNRAGQANALTYLGAARRTAGDYPGAAQVLEQTLSIFRDVGNRAGQGNALFELGILRRLTGDFPGAARALEESLAIFRDLDDPTGQAEALNATGALCQARGNPGRAEDCHRQALDLARKIASPREEASALAGLARCALSVSDIAGAVAGLRQARQIFERIGMPEAAGIAAELDALTPAEGTVRRRP
jgi:DNA-binding SARP family transcriptional activator/tetratricopeptide (TPR) repeat protein